MTDSSNYRPHALIVYAHPEPTSFTSAMKDAALRALEDAGMVVEVSDLYGEGFNPVAGRHDFTAEANPDRFHYQTEQHHAWTNKGYADDLVREQERFSRADLVLFVFPLWWGGIPAILKGWAERVFSYGFAYADGARFDKGFFRGRRCALALATGGPKARFSADNVYGEIDRLLYPVVNAIEYMGVKVAPPFVAYGAPRVSDEDRAAYLKDWAAQLTSIANDKEWLAERALARASGQADHRTTAPEGAWAMKR